MIKRQKGMGIILFVLGNILIFVMFAMIGISGYGPTFLASVDLTSPASLLSLLIFEVILFAVSSQTA